MLTFTVATSLASTTLQTVVSNPLTVASSTVAFTTATTSSSSTSAVIAQSQVVAAVPNAINISTFSLTSALTLGSLAQATVV